MESFKVSNFSINWGILKSSPVKLSRISRQNLFSSYSFWSIINWAFSLLSCFLFWVSSFSDSLYLLWESVNVGQVSFTFLSFAAKLVSIVFIYASSSWLNIPFVSEAFTVPSNWYSNSTNKSEGISDIFSLICSLTFSFAATESIKTVLYSAWTLVLVWRSDFSTASRASIILPSIFSFCWNKFINSAIFWEDLNEDNESFQLFKSLFKFEYDSKSFSIAALTLISFTSVSSSIEDSYIFEIAE